MSKNNDKKWFKATSVAKFRKSQKPTEKQIFIFIGKQASVNEIYQNKRL